MPKRDALRILFVSMEVAPFAKVGGLADVAGALPKALKRLGADVRIAMPAYAMIEADPRWKVKPLFEFDLTLNPTWTERVYVKETSLEPDLPVYLIGADRWFSEATVSQKIYQVGAEPYIFFDRALVGFIERFAEYWLPTVVHCNDWHTGLIPVYLKTLAHPLFEDLVSVFTVHNLAYQGCFEPEVLALAGLPGSLFHYEQLEFYGKVNFMKGGLVFSTMVNTVSPTYANEIQTEAYGERLDGLLRWLAEQKRLVGILNGIDYEVFNPETDPHLVAPYHAQNLEGKWKNKDALQEACGWSPNRKVAVIGLISRLVDQKGLDLLKVSMARLFRLPVQFVLLGTGDPLYERYFASLHRRHRERVHATIGFDPVWAQKIYAGADLFLMPSRFEPCGLGQMISLRYGTIPIVRKTGGLADTILAYNPDTETGHGFVFEAYTAEALCGAVQQAVRIFKDHERWQRLVRNAMQLDFSWNRSAQEYLGFYRQAIVRKKAGEVVRA